MGLEGLRTVNAVVTVQLVGTRWQTQQQDRQQTTALSAMLVGMVLRAALRHSAVESVPAAGTQRQTQPLVPQQLTA